MKADPEVERSGDDPPLRLLAPLPGTVAGCRPAYRVLIADDEAALRTVCRIFLELEDIACAEASDGVQALTAVRSRQFDLLLLDLDMPAMPGTEVLRRLREDPAGPPLKIILISGRLPPAFLAQLAATSADDYLAKPFAPEELADRIRKVLSGPDTARKPRSG